MSGQTRSKHQPRTVGTLRFLVATTDKITIREEGVPNTVSIDRATVVPSRIGDGTTGNPDNKENGSLVDGAGEDAGSDRDSDPRNGGTQTIAAKAPTETAEFFVNHIIREVEVNGDTRYIIRWYG